MMKTLISFALVLVLVAACGGAQVADPVVHGARVVVPPGPHTQYPAWLAMEYRDPNLRL